MSYLDQINNIQNGLFSYQEQLQGQQDSLASQAQELLNEKIQNVAEKLEFIGTAGMAGIETLGKVRDLATKGVKIYEKGKQAVQEGIQQASETAQNVVEGARTGAQRLVAGAQQVSENLGFGEQTAGVTSRLSAGIDAAAGQTQGAIQGATQQTQDIVDQATAQADEAVSGAVNRVEGAVSGAQAELRGGLDTVTNAGRQATSAAGAQLQSRLQELEQLGTNVQSTVRATGEQVSGAARAGAQQLDAAAQAASDIPPVSVPSLTANLPENPALNFTMSDPADTPLTRLLPTDLTDVSSTAAGRFSAGVLAQRPQIQAVIRETSEAAGAGGRGSSVRMGDAINEFLERTAPPPRATLSSANAPQVQASADISRQRQAAFDSDPEAGVRFETDFSNIPEIGNLEASTATNALSGGSTVVAGSRVSGAVGATTDTAGTTGTLSTTGTTTTTTGTTVATTSDTAVGSVGTSTGTVVGEEVGEGIGSLIGDAIPVIGELAMLGTAMAGIFESIFKHPVETFTPQIVSAVGYDPSSLTSTFSGEGGTV